jgi:hypothetical protein
MSRPALKPTQPPIQWVLGGKSWLGHDADHSASIQFHGQEWVGAILAPLSTCMECMGQLYFFFTFASHVSCSLFRSEISSSPFETDISTTISRQRYLDNLTSWIPAVSEYVDNQWLPATFLCIRHSLCEKLLLVFKWDFVGAVAAFAKDPCIVTTSTSMMLHLSPLS